MSDSLTEAVKGINGQIYSAAVRANRDPSDIKLIAVTKTIPAEVIRDAVNGGLRLLGENRVQEAKKKILELRDDLISAPSWHMIGHLQSNKAKLAVQLFDVIQSVDSISLARRVNNCAAEIKKVQRILLQVKLSEEESKSGLNPAELTSFLEETESMRSISVEGLMLVPPYCQNPDDVRPYFTKLRKLREELAIKGFNLPELSMGMSRDFELAVEEGATMVRVGRSIFGERLR